jgi:hypothetical protein
MVRSKIISILREFITANKNTKSEKFIAIMSAKLVEGFKVAGLKC